VVVFIEDKFGHRLVGAATGFPGLLHQLRVDRYQAAFVRQFKIYKTHVPPPLSYPLPLAAFPLRSGISQGCGSNLKGWLRGAKERQRYGRAAGGQRHAARRRATVQCLLLFRLVIIGQVGPCLMTAVDSAGAAISNQLAHDPLDALV